jgi:hypothetical protein
MLQKNFNTTIEEQKTSPDQLSFQLPPNLRWLF